MKRLTLVLVMAVFLTCSVFSLVLERECSAHDWKALADSIVGWYEGKIISIEQLNSATCWVVIQPVSMSRAVEIAENVGHFIRNNTGCLKGETPSVHVFMAGRHIAIARPRGMQYIGKVDLDDWDPSAFDGEYRP